MEYVISIFVKQLFLHQRKDMLTYITYTYGVGFGVARSD